jgi:3-oxoacyl-[acyl-carrier-protein] synthase II
MKERVVITGIGLATPIGHDLATVSAALQNDRHGVVVMNEWSFLEQLQTRLAGRITDIDFKGRWDRKKVRTMGRVSLLANFATERAIQNAGLDDAYVRSGKVGLAYGSTHGSSAETESFCRKLFETSSLKGMESGAYIKFMSHTCAANLAQFHGIRGRVITTCAACVSAAQAVGYAYEAIKHGSIECMVAGGAEELHFMHAGVFDILYATSTHYNDRPSESPRPFDAARDGLVVGEGAGTVVLETYERARARGAPILAEILGFGTNCDGTHVTSPSTEGMAGAMRLALEDAALSADRIQYINAHATATAVGDVAESRATMDVFGKDTPISSTKGFTGHTLGACGTIELGFAIAMMHDRFLAPNRNLTAPDPECAPLDYVIGAPRAAKPTIIMSNNFAFGGINTSLIIGKV